VYALYDRPRTLTSVLLALFAAEIAVLCAVLAYVTPRTTFNASCFVTSIPFLFVAYWFVVFNVPVRAGPPDSATGSPP